MPRKTLGYLSAGPANDEYGSGGNGGGGDVLQRVAVLEYQAKSIEARLGRIEDKQDRVLEAMSKLPTMNGLWGMIATVIGTSIAFTGTIIAVLAWVQGFHH